MSIELMINEKPACQPISLDDDLALCVALLKQEVSMVVVARWQGDKNEASWCLNAVVMSSGFTTSSSTGDIERVYTDLNCAGHHLETTHKQGSGHGTARHLVTVRPRELRGH